MRLEISSVKMHNGAASGGYTTTQGIKWIGVFYSTIVNNRIHDNTGAGTACTSGGNGIFINGVSGYGAWNNTITENTIYNNTKGGFLTRMMCRDTTVSHNNVYGNGQGGINTIEENNVHENYGSGIFIGGPDNVIRHNTITNNRNGSAYTGVVGKYGMGINLGRNDGSYDNEIVSNTICGNEGVDIEVCVGVTGNAGSKNTCDVTLNYDDIGATGSGCTYSCSEPVLKGDLNHDGVVTPADAVIALQMAARGEYSVDADMNEDDRVTSLDALMILQRSQQ